MLQLYSLLIEEHTLELRVLGSYHEMGETPEIINDNKINYIITLGGKLNIS